MTQTLPFFKTIARKFIENDIIAYAYQLTFSILMAAFPFLIFLFTLIGYTGLDTNLILTTLESYLPGEIFLPISEIVVDVVGKQHGALLSVSILLTIWSASTGFRTLMSSLDKAFESNKKRPLWAQFLWSLVGVIVLSVFVVLALGSFVFGNYIIDALTSFTHLETVGALSRNLFTIVMPILLIFVAFFLIYRILPSDHVSFRRAIFASLFATSAWTIFTFLFRIYVDLFMDYSRFYGVLGSVVGLLFWILVTSMITLLSGVIAGSLPEKAQKKEVTLLD